MNSRGRERSWVKQAALVASAKSVSNSGLSRSRSPPPVACAQTPRPQGLEPDLAGDEPDLLSDSSASAECAAPKRRGRPRLHPKSNEKRKRGRPRLLPESTDAKEEPVQVPTDFSALVRVGVGTRLETDLVALVSAPDMKCPPRQTITQAVADRALDIDRPRPLSCITSESEMLGYKNVTYVRDSFRIFGALTHFADKFPFVSLLSWMHTQIDSGKIELVIAFRALLSDATDMRASWSRETPSAEEKRSGIASAGEHSPGTEVSKILQSSFRPAFIVKVVGSGEYMLLRADLICHLQCADSMTGEAIKHMLQKHMDLPLYVQLLRKAKYVSDIHEADRGSVNGVCNRLFRHENVGHLRLDDLGCQVHTLHTAVGQSLGISENFISGIIAIALAEQPAGALSYLREALSELLLENATPRYKTEPPPPTHHTTRQHPWERRPLHPKEEGLRLGEPGPPLLPLMQGPSRQFPEGG